MLEFVDLAFDYARAGIRCDFKVARGECVALMGPSGSGKSTLLNLAAGFLEPQCGDIRFDGKRLSGLKPARRPVTILFQEHNLFAHLSAHDNVAIGIRPNLRLDDQAARRVTRALENTGLGNLGDQLPAQLSGGQRQRVAIARVMVRERPVLLLDEPFSGLDRALREDLVERIKSLIREQRPCVLFATHSLEEAKSLGDRTMLFEQSSDGIAHLREA